MPNINQSAEFTDARREARRLREANRVLTHMAAGAELQLTFTPNGPRWTCDGSPITDAVAQLVIGSSSITPVSGGLFQEAPAQVWAWWRSASREK